MRILVVDDDAELRDLLVTALRRRGHEVEGLPSAFGVTNALAGRVGASRPDVLVLDHGLPALSGGNLLELLTRDADTAKVPVLLYSAAPYDMLVRLAQGHPCCTPLMKDGRISRVIATVEALGQGGPLPPGVSTVTPVEGPLEQTLTGFNPRLN